MLWLQLLKCNDFPCFLFYITVNVMDYILALNCVLDKIRKLLFTFYRLNNLAIN